MSQGGFGFDYFNAARRPPLKGPDPKSIKVVTLLQSQPGLDWSIGRVTVAPSSTLENHVATNRALGTCSQSSNQAEIIRIFVA